jgi:hypothetical protein
MNIFSLGPHLHKAEGGWPYFSCFVGTFAEDVANGYSPLPHFLPCLLKLLNYLF